MIRRRLGALGLVLALALGGCAPLRPQVGTPVPVSAPVHRLQETKKVLDVVKRVGLVAEQVQSVEIAMFKAGEIPPDVHASVQKSFLKTADAVLASIDALAGAATAIDPHAVVTAITDGLHELLAKLDVLPPGKVNQLTGWLDTAVALLEVLL